MIIRVFRPTIHAGKEAEFESFLRDTAIPLVSQQKGVVAQHVGRPRDSSSTVLGGPNTRRPPRLPRDRGECQTAAIRQ